MSVCVCGGGGRSVCSTDLCCVPRHAWATSDVFVCALQEACGVTACLGQDTPCEPVGLLKQGLGQVLCLDNLLAVLLSNLGCCNDGLQHRATTV